MKTMNPEERFERIDRRLECMSGVLAELVASSQRHDAEIAQTAQVTAQNAQQISQLAGVIRDLAHVTAKQGNRIEAGFKRMEERQQQTDEQMKRTDERLNALIAMDERRRSNSQN